MRLATSRLPLGTVTLAFLALAIPLIAQSDHSSPRSAPGNGSIHPRSHTRVPRRSLQADTTEVNSNWSGYALTGSTFTGVTGYWTTPAIECTKRPNNSDASFWVGIDGYPGSDSSYVEQTGTFASCDATVCGSKTPCYFAWYEFVQPGIDSPPQPCFSVSAGDVMYGTVSYVGSTSQFTTTLTDLNTGQDNCIGVATVPSAPASSAEWIAEAPTTTCPTPQTCTIDPLADFGRVSFTGGSATDASGTITAPGNGTELIFVSSNGNEVALPSALMPDGTGFSVQSLFTVWNFNGANESYPSSPLIQGFDGSFYGTTFLGGNSDPNSCDGDVYFAATCGTVFKIFPEPSGGCPAGSYTANGWCQTPIYSFCPNPTPAGFCKDGAFPSGALVLGLDGNFYGVAENGGSGGLHAGYGGLGTVYKLSPESPGGCPSGTNLGVGWCETTLYSFCSLAGCVDGADPIGALVQANDGNFYGTTLTGGTGSCPNELGCGTVFKITPSGAFSILYNFCIQLNCADGGLLSYGLVQGTDGNFYGITNSGGANGFGTIFRLSPAGQLVTLHNFCSLANCADGSNPNGPLVQASDGNFYGTTLTGGIQNGPTCSFTSASGQAVQCGTVFKITPSGTFTTLYEFCSQPNCADGANPSSGLVQGTDGNLYGTTHTGMCTAVPCITDTIFEITFSTTLTTLFANCQACGGGSDYNQPLVQATDGSFYGLGGGGSGTAFNFSVGLKPFVGVLPPSAAVGSAVTILGNGLTDTSGVNISGTAADFTVISDTELTAVVPSGSANSRMLASSQQSADFVTVTTPSGTLTSDVPFRVAATTTVALTPLSVPVGSAEPIVMTAHVNPPSGSNIPTGTVTFFNGLVPVGATTLTGGVAALNYNPSPLAAGNYSITALYSGDSTFGGSVSVAQALAVVSPNFTVAGTAVSVSPGATNGNTSTITVTPSGRFTGNVTLTATITSSPTGAQDPPTLSFGSTSPVSIASANAGTATLTISTTAATSGALTYPVRPGVRWRATDSAGLAFALAFGMGIPTRRRSWRARLGLLIFLVVLIGGLVACSSGGGAAGEAEASIPALRRAPTP
jgi:uncharacterized repeat protein (TIGR03803 family)